MKKVQAQRKFAHGVYMPTNANISTVVDRRTDVGAGKDPKNVFHNNTSAKTLLDMVSFESLHTHTPIVLIERLPETNLNVADDSESVNINNYLQPDFKTSKPLWRPCRALQISKLSSRIPTLKNPETMLLRSRTRIDKTYTKTWAVKKTIPKSAKKKVQRKQRTVVDYQSEDETPLKFLSKESTFKETPPRNNSTLEYTNNDMENTNNDMENTVNGIMENTYNSITKNSYNDVKNTQNYINNKSNYNEITNNNVMEDNKDVSMNIKSDNIEITNNIVMDNTSMNIKRDNIEINNINMENTNYVSIDLKSPIIEITNNDLMENTITDMESINSDIMESTINDMDSINSDTENSIIEIDKEKVLEPINLDDDTEDFDEDETPGNHICNEISQWLLHRAHKDHRISEEEEMYEEPNMLVNNAQKKGTKRKRQANVCKDISTKDLCRMLKSCNNLCDFINSQKQTLKKCLNCIVIYRKCRIMILLKEHEDKFHPGRSCRLSCIRKNNKEIVTIDLTIEEKCDPRDAEDEKERSENSLLAIIKQNLISDSVIPITDLSELKNLMRDIILGINNASSSGSARSSSPISESAISDSDDSSNVPIPTTMRGQSKTINANSDQETLNPQPGTSGTAADGICAQLVEALVFSPTNEEFKDPVAYFEKIMPVAAKYGLCKVVAPDDFKPTCNLDDNIRFNVFNQYIARVFERWGPVTRELCAIRAQAATQNVVLARPPLVGGIEVDLVKMFHAVQRNGGLKALNRKKWLKIAEELHCEGVSNPDKKLDLMYLKCLVPYDSLAKRGRQEYLNKMEVLWLKRNMKMLERAMNPLHRQKRLLAEADSSSDEESEDSSDPIMTSTLKEVEDCVVRGRNMNLSNFKSIAQNGFKIFFPNGANEAQIEHSYWKIVEFGNEHVCVNSASIDTGSEGYGFIKNHYQPYGNHPWNLKMLSQNKGNVLRLLGPVIGLTVPTLHLGMVYSTNCWHRDPHGLPWMEYMHEGSQKIWYGISDEESCRFRKAVENLSPSSCQNKSIWLPSDITMIPPKLLLEHGVSLSRVVQNPGEFIIVFPKSYSCSISTGYTVSESVYFATNSWVNSIHQVFQELRNSCEPTMFSLEQLLFSAAKDPRASPTMLQLVYAKLVSIISDEIENRTEAQRKGLVPRFCKRRNGNRSWNVLTDDECEICRTTLYLSRVKGVFQKSYAVCISHAIRIIDDPKISKREVAVYEFELFFTNTELEDIKNLAKRRLIKPTRK